MSPDGRRLVTGGGSGRLLVWNVQRKSWLRELAPAPSQVQIIKFSPSGRYVAVGSRHQPYEIPGLFVVYSVDTGRKVARLDRGTVADARFMDERRIKVVLGKKTVLWNFKTSARSPTSSKGTPAATKTRTPVLPYKVVKADGGFDVVSSRGEAHWKLRHGASRLRAFFDARSGKLVTVDSNGIIFRRNPTTGQTEHTLKAACKLEGLQPALYGGSAVTRTDGRVRMIDLATGVCKPLWRGMVRYALCTDGALLAVEDRQAAVVVDVASGRVVRRVDTPFYRIFSVGFTRSGDSVVVTGLRRNERKEHPPWIAFINRRTGKLERLRRCHDGHHTYKTTALSAERVAVTGAMFYAFDVVRRTGREPSRIVGQTEQMSQSQLYGTATLDGRAFAHADLGGRVFVWNTKTWKRIRTLRHDLEVTGLSFSPCGRYLAVLLEGGSVTYYRTHL